MVSSQPAATLDLVFFRNTGFILVVATLIAGALTLFLTLTESRSIILDPDAQAMESTKIVTAEATGASPTASQE